jgi:hypothetical protein
MYISVMAYVQESQILESLYVCMYVCMYVCTCASTRVIDLRYICVLKSWAAAGHTWQTPEGSFLKRIFAPTEKLAPTGKVGT